MLKCVPFNNGWINHQKLDLHAIYQRPRFVRDEFDEMYREYNAQGEPTWDLTGPLPVKAHVHWAAKGFRYVTLADLSSLMMAAANNMLLDDDGNVTANYQQYVQHQNPPGPWSYKKYLAGQTATLNAAAVQLRADVEEFGSEAVERLRKRQEPDFALPPSLRGIPPGGKVQATPEATGLEVAAAVKEKERRKAEKASA